MKEDAPGRDKSGNLIMELLDFFLEKNEEFSHPSVNEQITLGWILSLKREIIYKIKKVEVSLEIENVQNLVHIYNVFPGNFFNLLKYDGSSPSVASSGLLSNKGLFTVRLSELKVEDEAEKLALLSLS